MFSFLPGAICVTGDIYLNEGLSLTWVCLHGKAPLYVITVSVGEKGSDEVNAKARTASATSMSRDDGRYVEFAYHECSVDDFVCEGDHMTGGPWWRSDICLVG